MVAIVTVFTLVSCSATTKGGDFDPIAVPYSYSFTEIDENTLTLSLFVGRKDSKFSNPDNYSSMEIVSDKNTIQAQISGNIIYDDVPLGQISNRDIYLVTLPLTLGVGAGFELSDAYLAIQWRNGETDNLYIGDISFALADDTPSQSDEITFCALNPIGRMGEKDTYTMPAFELRIDVSRDICLKEVDFGLSKYGIDKNNVLVFNQDADIQRVDEALINKSIFEDYPCHFTLATNEAPSYSVDDLLLTKGSNLLILPLVSSVTNYNTIVKTGVKLAYTVEGVEKGFLVSQKLHFEEILWKIDVVKDLSNDVRN